MNMPANKNEPIVNWIIDYDEKYERQIIHLREQYPNRYTKMRDFLTTNPDLSVGGHRVFPLMGDDQRGTWEYKVSVSKQTFRIFYMLDITNHKVQIYYAGPKPNKVPRPPPKRPSLSIGETLPSYDSRRFGGKNDKNRQR